MNSYSVWRIADRGSSEIRDSYNGLQIHGIGPAFVLLKIEQRLSFNHCYLIGIGGECVYV